MSGYNSENTHVLATHEQAGNTRMLLLHICDGGRHEYVIGSYFSTYREYIDRWIDGAGNFHTVVADEDGNCFTLDRHQDVGRVNGKWEGAFDKPGKFYYEWDWGHYFADVVDAVDYWKREVLEEWSKIGNEETGGNMATYEFKPANDERSDYDDALYRDDKIVGEFGYNDLTDCCMWWFDAPDGEMVKDDFADCDMSPADFRQKVRLAYGD